MKNRRANRLGAVLWTGLGLIGLGALYFFLAPSVESEVGALLGQGVTISQAAIMRSLGVVDVLAGLFVLIRPRMWPGLVGAGVAAIGLSLLPRLKAQPPIELGSLVFDGRILIVILQIVVIVTGIAVAFFWQTRARREPGKAPA